MDAGTGRRSPALAGELEDAVLDSGEFEEASHSRTFKRGVGLPGRVWSAGRPDWITDLAADSNFPRATFATASGLRSAFAFPIMVGEDMSGVIELFTRETHEPDRPLLDVMTGIGNQI